MPEITLADRLKARYTTQRRRIEVPELSGITDADGPMVFYADLFTLNDEKAIGPFLAADSPEGYAQIWKLKAINEDGSPYFTDDRDLFALMAYVDANVIKRVAMDIYGGVSQSDAVGNSTLTED